MPNICFQFHRLEDVKRRSVNVNTDEDPSGWRPYFTFVNQLREKYAKNEMFPGTFLAKGKLYYRLK